MNEGPGEGLPYSVRRWMQTFAGDIQNLEQSAAGGRNVPLSETGFQDVALVVLISQTAAISPGLAALIPQTAVVSPSLVALIPRTAAISLSLRES